jgi:hypothetical protein
MSNPVSSSFSPVAEKIRITPLFSNKKYSYTGRLIHWISLISYFSGCPIPAGLVLGTGQGIAPASGGPRVPLPVGGIMGSGF